LHTDFKRFMEHSKQEKARGSIDSVDGYPQVFIAHISIDVIGTRATDDSSFLNDTGTTHHLVADRNLLKKLVDLEVPPRFGLANTDTKIEKLVQRERCDGTVEADVGT